jgi:hypothetical protein
VTPEAEFYETATTRPTVPGYKGFIETAKKFFK